MNKDILVYMKKCKNGPRGFGLHFYRIDLLAPTMKVEGMQYIFNSKLIRSEYHQEK